MKKIEKIELVIIVILVVVFGGTLIYSRLFVNNAEENKIDNTVIALQDENRFFTIDSAISKYISYVASGDTANIIKLLDTNFVSNNNITSNNLFNYIESYDTNYVGSTREVYQVSYNDNIYKYYVKVRLLNEDFVSSTFVKYTYFEVTINENNLTFAVAPISSVMYSNKIEEADSNND